jgi:hypothetical protein
MTSSANVTENKKKFASSFSKFDFCHFSHAIGSADIEIASAEHFLDKKNWTVLVNDFKFVSHT